MFFFFVAVSREFQSPSQLSDDSSKCDEANSGTFQRDGNDLDVKKMIQMLEQQASLAQQGKYLHEMCRKHQRLCGSDGS